jgi:alpha/beta superfamily hydrolase
MLVLLKHMQSRFPGLPVALSGFSFGTFVQAQLQRRLLDQNNPAERLVLIGAAAGKWAMPVVPPDTILIHGEQDDTITAGRRVRLGAPAGHPGDRDSRRRPFFPSQAAAHQKPRVTMWRR